MAEQRVVRSRGDRSIGAAHPSLETSARNDLGTCSDGTPLRRATGRHGSGWIAKIATPAPKSRPGVGPILYSVTLSLFLLSFSLSLSPSLPLCRDDRPRRTADLPQRPPTRRICIRVSVPLSRAPSPSRPPSFASRSLALPTSYPAYHLPTSRPSATPFSLFVPPLLFCQRTLPCCVSGTLVAPPSAGSTVESWFNDNNTPLPLLEPPLASPDTSGRLLLQHSSTSPFFDAPCILTGRGFRREDCLADV